MRIVGLALIAALAMSSLATTRASAEPPEFGRCAKKAKAEGIGYSDKKCSKSAEGANAKYEWLPGPGPKPGFTVKGGEAHFISFSVNGVRQVICTASEGAGMIVGNKTTDGSYRYTGCALAGVATCASSGEPEGTIEFPEFTGALGIIHPGKIPSADDVGIAVGDSAVTTLTCGGVTVMIKGHVILTITHPTKMSLTATLETRVKHGAQYPQGFVGGPSEILEMSSYGEEFLAVRFETVMVQTFEEAIERNPAV
jgi:hypothetical protein